MRRLTICLTLALPLLLAGSAAAKEVVSAKVCGKTDCRTVKDRDDLIALQEGGPPADPPAGGRAGFFEVRMTVAIEDGRHDTFPLAIVPSAGLMRGGDADQGYTWMSVSPATVRAYRRVTRGIEPFAAAALEGLDAHGQIEARVDEVVLPPDDPKPDGGTPVWIWLVGGAGLLALAGVAIRVRRRGLPWPRTAEG
jgi:hypothetical protein